MAERTGYPHGTFSWVDCATGDLAGAKRFYGGLFGWEFRDMPSSDGTYSMASLHGTYVAAAYASQQPPPRWQSYVTVDDIHATAQRARELGGSIVFGPAEVEGAGHTLALADPQVALICAWQPGGHAGAGLVNAPGALCWNELRTTDVAFAQQFYGPLFGWTFAGWSEADEYVICQVGDRANGGISPLSADPGDTAPNWGVSFGCTAIGDVVSRARDLGGSAVNDVSEMPNLGSFAVLADPQGTVFSVFEGEFAD